MTRRANAKERILARRQNRRKAAYAVSNDTRLQSDNSLEEDLAIETVLQTGRMPKGAFVSPETANSFLAAYSPEYNDNDESLRDVILLPIAPARLVEQMKFGSVDLTMFKVTGIHGAAVTNGSTDKSGVQRSSMQFLINAKDSQIWQKYILAHMLGHYFNGHYTPLGCSYEVKKTLADLNSADSHERAANMWAMDFLIPPDILSGVIESKMPVAKIIDLFEVPAVVLKAQSDIIGHPLPIFHAVDVPDAMGWLQ